MKYTIVITEGQNRKKITKIFTYSDGGFAMAVPYHSAKKGFLIKTEVDYKKHEQYVAGSEEYVASDRVKLSIHMDGFVQFSGENPGKILSGRDESGKPKGLGYLTSPLTTPIKSGPTFGMTFWGLNDYKDYTVRKESEIVLEFNESELYFRDPQKQCNGFALEGFVLPTWLLTNVKADSDGKYFISKYFPNFEPKPTTFKLRVLHTESKYFIGLLLSRIKLNVTTPSGFMFGGPSELKNPKNNIGTMMMAIYPDPSEAKRNARNLDYQKE